MHISAVVLTYNEARRIRDCLASLAWADETLVVDGGSTDGTREVAGEFAIRVLVSDLLGPSNPGGYAAQRNFALQEARGEWVFFVDADERCTPELAAEIRAAIASASSEVDAFSIRREEFFFGIRSPHTHGSSRLVRLARKGKARWNVRAVHEGLEAEGATIPLVHPLRHFCKESLEDYLATQNRYTSLEAEEALRSGREPGRTPLPDMLRAFCNMYLYKQGWREGTFGFVMSLLMAQYSFLCWAKRWENRVREKRVDPNAPMPWMIELPARLLGRAWRALRPPHDRDS